MRARIPSDHDDMSPEYRHGLLMRQVTDHESRITYLERLAFRVSVRPQVKTAGTASVVAGALFGILELLRYSGVFK